MATVEEVEIEALVPATATTAEGQQQEQEQDDELPELQSTDIAERTALISRVSVFADVAAEDPGFCAALAARCVPRWVAPGELFAKGDEADEMFFVVAGTVQIYADMRAPPVAELHADDMVGVGELLMNRPRSAFAVAAVGTRVLVLAKADLEAVLPLRPGVETQLTRFATDRLQRRESRECFARTQA
jgi:CRP-like cAMP-binding protein